MARASASSWHRRSFVLRAFSPAPSNFSNISSTSLCCCSKRSIAFTVFPPLGTLSTGRERRRGARRPPCADRLAPLAASATLRRAPERLGPPLGRPAPQGDVLRDGAHHEREQRDAAG